MNCNMPSWPREIPRISHFMWYRNLDSIRFYRICLPYHSWYICGMGRFFNLLWSHMMYCLVCSYIVLWSRYFQGTSITLSYLFHSCFLHIAIKRTHCHVFFQEAKLAISTLAFFGIAIFFLCMKYDRMLVGITAWNITNLFRIFPRDFNSFAENSFSNACLIDLRYEL